MEIHMRLWNATLVEPEKLNTIEVGIHVSGSVNGDTGDISRKNKTTAKSKTKVPDSA
jgi:hypothetical protein